MEEHITYQWFKVMNHNILVRTLDCPIAILDGIERCLPKMEVLGVIVVKSARRKRAKNF